MESHLNPLPSSMGVTNELLLLTAWIKYLPEVLCDGGWEAEGS